MNETHTTNSAEETYALGKRFGETLTEGDIVALFGGLGAGKTVFAKGIASGLGIEEEVVSPTFTLLKTYDGRETMNHFDLYRIESEEELAHIGFYDTLQGGISVIEWPENADGLPPCIAVRLSGSGDDHRLIKIERPEEV